MLRSSLFGASLTVFCLAFVFGTLSVHAQTTSGTLLGAVQDQNRKGLAGVKVTVENEENSNRRATKTDDYGNYAVFNLPPGTYRIIASKPGFHDDTIKSFPIQFNQKNVVKLPVFTLFTAKLHRTDSNSAENRWLKPQFILASAQATPSPTPPHAITIMAAPVEDQVPAALANTTDAARSSNFSERQIHTLPVGGTTAMRSFDELALLLPGVAPPPYTPGVRGPGVGFGIGTAGQFSVNGMRARANNFSVDGSDNNDPDVGVRRQGFMALVPQPIESVKEISISTLLWDAELGRNMGGQVNAVTKYGGNEYHGGAYAFFNDSRLNAKNFFATGDKPPFTRTQLGFNFGGPIVRERSQFFLSFEDDQSRASVIEHFATPALTERNLFGPGAEFMATGPTGPFTDVTPLGRNVLSNYPAPNNPLGPYGSNTFSARLPADGDAKIFSIRLTDNLNEDHSANLRYNFSDDQRVLPSTGGAIRSTIDSHTRSHNLSLIVDSALGSRLFNQARFSFGRTQLNLRTYAGNPPIFASNSVETDPAQCVGAPPCTSQTGPMGQLLIVPYSPVGIDPFTFPQRRASNTFQLADSLSLTKGKHVLKFGGNIRRYQLNSILDRLYRPQVIFGGALLSAPGDPVAVPISGVQLASIGVASSLFQTITNGTPDSTIGLRFTELHTFINDNWKVHPRLNLDLGLRYELNTVPVEVNRKIERALGLEDLPVAGSSRFDAPDRTFRYGAAIDTYRQILDGRTRIYDPDRNNFGPHVGFAWSLGAERETSLRAGYGVYYDVVLGAVVSQSRNVFPNEVPINVDPRFLGFDLLSLNNPVFLALTVDANNNPVVPVVRLLAPGSCNQFGTCNQFGGAPADFAALIGQLFIQNRNGGLAFTLPEKHLRTPYAQQWHVTLESELGRNHLFSAAYVGTKGTKLLRLTTPNRGPNVTPQIQVLPPVLPGQPFPLLNLSTTRTGFILVLPDHETCEGGGGVAVGPPDAIFCLEPDDRPNPFAGPFQIFESSASSSYHALQLEARTRYHQSYQFTAAYTWSHAIDDVSDLFPIAGAPVIAQDSANLRAERASANFDVRHRFTASVLWDLPFFEHSQSAAKRILRDWQIASVFQAQAGQPFTLNVPFDANLDGNLTDRTSTTDGLIFLDGNNPQKVAIAPGRSVTDFFVLEKNGVIGRNTVRGANLIDVDVAVSRTLKFGEEKKLQLRAEFFNVFNRANFGLPVRTIGAPGFGSAVATATPGRTIVLAVKSSF